MYWKEHRPVERHNLEMPFFHRGPRADDPKVSRDSDYHQEEAHHNDHCPLKPRTPGDVELELARMFIKTLQIPNRAEVSKLEKNSAAFVLHPECGSKNETRREVSSPVLPLAGHQNEVRQEDKQRYESLRLGGMNVTPRAVPKDISNHGDRSRRGTHVALRKVEDASRNSQEPGRYPQYQTDHITGPQGLTDDRIDVKNTRRFDVQRSR